MKNSAILSLEKVWAIIGEQPNPLLRKTKNSCMSIVNGLLKN
jgi:hypothetical protein